VGPPSHSSLNRRLSARRPQRVASSDRATNPLGRAVEALPGQADEVEMEAPDHDLVPVLELVPVDPLTVQEDPVQAAVVEYADASLVPVKQRMAARHGRVVEAHVRSEAAAETRPPLLERYYADVAVFVEGEVVGPRVELGARVREPGRVLDLVGADRLRGRVLPKDGCTPETAGVAVWARGDFVTLVEGDGESAGLAPEGARPRQRAGYEGVDGVSLGPDRADDNELIRL
jgi:hypothetical protein